MDKYWIDLGQTYGSGGVYSSLAAAKRDALEYARGYYYNSCITCIIRRIDDNANVAYVSHHYYDLRGKYHPAKYERCGKYHPAKYERY